MDALRVAGARVETFREARLGKLTRLHKRNHRRAIVIDGKVGFTGGMGVDDQWRGDARNEQEWRDSMVEVTGPRPRRFSPRSSTSGPAPWERDWWGPSSSLPPTRSPARANGSRSTPA